MAHVLSFKCQYLLILHCKQVRLSVTHISILVLNFQIQKEPISRHICFRKLGYAKRFYEELS
jgi:hypothetical protein